MAARRPGPGGAEAGTSALSVPSAAPSARAPAPPPRRPGAKPCPPSAGGPAPAGAACNSWALADGALRVRLRGPPGLPFRSPRRLHPRQDPPRASPRGRSLGPEDRWARRFGPGARALPHSLSLGVLRASRGASPGFIPPSGGLKRPRRRAAGTELRAASAAAGGAQPPALRTRSAWLRPRRPGRPLGAATTFRSAGRTVDPPGARGRPGRGREPTRPAGVPGASRGCCWARVQAGGSPCSPPLLSGLGALRLAPPPPPPLRPG